MNKAFIFDWSGTLSDSFHCFCKVCDLIFSEMGRQPVSQEEIKLHITSPYMKFWNFYFPDLSQEKEMEMYSRYVHQVEDPEVYPTVLDTVRFLHDMGWKIFVVSSDPLSKLFLEIEKSGLRPYLQKVIGEVHEKVESISLLVDEFQLDKDQTYYVGDTTGDMEAAKIVEIQTIGISWGFQHKTVLAQSNPDFLVDDIIEIKDIIE